MTTKQTPQANGEAKTTRLSYVRFTEAFIKTHKVAPYKGVHVVFSHFNDAFKAYFNEEPRPILDKLAAKGDIVVRPAKRGAMIYMPKDAPEARDTGADAAGKALAAMGLKPAGK